ncbi:MAG: NADP-dependent oxidoreductase [Halobacteriaceae archaeon]
MAETHREIHLAERPDGMPDESTFHFVETDRPTPGPEELLIKNLYVSVDPYMRGRMRDSESYAPPWSVDDVIPARTVGEVIQSNHPDFEPGDFVYGYHEWAEYSTNSGNSVQTVDPDLAPLPSWLGVLGMTGRTAYFGMLEVGQPKPGETAVISGAAGAVGSIAGQIASLAGCSVIGIAGSDEKTRYLTSELGFDEAINYKTDTVPDALDTYCPEGVDLYFDNVGGEITDAVIERLATDATVVVCGQIALYNEEETPVGPRHFWKLVETRARVEGFLVGDYQSQYEAANEQLAEWIENDDIAYRETIKEGFENIPEAFIGLFEGVNIGKLVVQIAEVENKNSRPT